MKFLEDIRVGDLVVFGDGEGYVRKISVRATEIETLDRSTVIVQNSNLISGTVKNRVRGDRTGQRDVHHARFDDRETVFGVDREDSRKSVEADEDHAVGERERSVQAQRAGDVGKQVLDRGDADGKWTEGTDGSLRNPAGNAQRCRAERRPGAPSV